MPDDHRRLHLNLNFLNAGTVGSAWRWPGNDPKAFFDIDYYIRVAQLAEKGTFDSVFLADFPALTGRPDFAPFQSLEPTIALAVISAHTRHIGLIATISSSFNEPFNIARRFATLDHASRGRIGINIVTSADRGSALNFGRSDVVPHAERYARADEFTSAIKALWSSWDDDAVIGDQAGGRFIDVSKVREVGFSGAHFTIRGPLNVPKGPQGRPVIVQAGGSAEGTDLAARHADAVFALAHELDDAVSYSRTLRERAAAHGRDPASVLVFPGLVTIIGGTEEEARRREQEIWDLLPLELGLARLAGTLGVDPATLDPDKPLPDDLKLPENGIQTFFLGTTRLARAHGWTVRELIRYQRGGTHHRVVVGTPEQIADGIETWFRAGAVDGFNVMPDVLPSGLESFVDEVVPLLRRRGLFREAYDGTTLRDHFGLARA
ncbi:LLM class flavin-dependent oxidoreductase [Xanthobacter sp. V4C-4]|uniref:LLM class flavin-dependent oxidoreductase n=1 Tax=Xanthobacter cornucopiae TaxID=3119924 RepID=UPI003728ED67